MIGPRTWVEINREALQSNIKQIQSILHEEADFCAVVKSNAYGHEFDGVVQVCINLGIGTFMVNTYAESRQIHKSHPHAKVYIWNQVFFEESFKTTPIRNSIFPIHQLSDFEFYKDIAEEKGQMIEVNLIFNTGMNRFGFNKSEVKRVLQECIQKQNFIKVTSVSSHLSSADTVSTTVSEKQNKVFLDILKEIYSSPIKPEFAHIANSAGVIQSQEYHYNLVRVGALMYGLMPSGYTEKRSKIKHNLQLTPVLSWKTRITQIRDVTKGESIGYGSDYLCDRPMRIGLIPVGYGDGLIVSHRQGGQVLVQGRFCKILSVTMNTSFIDLGAIPKAELEHEVTLIGKSSMNSIDAKWSEYDTRHITTSIEPSIPRLYI